MQPQLILAVAIGGAVGSVLRYLVGIESGRLFGTEFPWGTLIINVSGSFLIGVFAALFATKWNAQPSAKVFLIVGICGGYTTFSTFALDVWYLIERGQLVASLAYILASVILSTVALIGALHLIRVLT
jgi:fluoride exporter